MSDYSSVFPWPSNDGHFDFFERCLRSHTDVRKLTAAGDGQYSLTRNSGQTLRVFVCDCEEFGAEEYGEVTNRLGLLEVVILNARWCRYSQQAKIECRQDSVGLFKVADFMAALNRYDYWTYLNEGELVQFWKDGLL